MSGLKWTVCGAMILCLASCAEPGRHQQASNDSQAIMRRKSVHSPYIATGRAGDPAPQYPRQGEYRNFGTVDAPAAIAAPPQSTRSRAEVPPPAASRRVINQVTNEPVQ